MKKIQVIKFDKESRYEYLIIGLNEESFFNHKEEIKNICNESIVLIDQILHTGNTNKRFVRFDCRTGKIKFVSIPEKSEYRRLACTHLRENNLVNNSILTSTQKQMINDGFSI